MKAMVRMECKLMLYCTVLYCTVLYLYCTILDLPVGSRLLTKEIIREHI